MESDYQDSAPPVAQGIYRIDGDGPGGAVLLGGHCPNCGQYCFPRSLYCRTCLEPQREATLGDRGVIYSYTVVRTKPPYGLPQPYAVGYIDLDAVGLRVFGLFDPADIERLAIGRPVKLAVRNLGVNREGSPCNRPVFTIDDTRQSEVAS